jgi:serine/threonine protein kinase
MSGRTKTRKQNKPIIYLQYLKKNGGGRIENLITLKPVCSPEEAHAKLIATHSLKTPYEADDFVHVLKSKIMDKEVIVKVQEAGRMLNMELSIQRKINNLPNIVKYVCDFSCKFDQLIWTKPISKPRTFCDTEGKSLHIIVMEYINNSLDTFLESETYTDKIVISIVKQLGFTLLDLHVNYGISHNDLNRGNILLHVGNPEIITYTIDGFTRNVDTLGYLVVLIDFQRSSFVDTINEYEFRVIQAADEISLAYELLKKWIERTEKKEKLHTLMQQIMYASCVKEIVTFIDAFETYYVVS